jgi:hypothetical protein
MQTASLLEYFGPGRIAICRWTQRWMPGGYRVFKPLVPGDWCKLTSGQWVDDDTFERGYAEQLAALCPAQTWDALHALHPGQEPVLLCWERPPLVRPGNWCHRSLVADWFKAHLGQVDELGVPA